MSAGQAAGTHCALSEFCVGTTTQRGSCDLGPLALWLGSESCRGESKGLGQLSQPLTPQRRTTSLLSVRVRVRWGQPVPNGGMELGIMLGQRRAFGIVAGRCRAAQA